MTKGKVRHGVRGRIAAAARIPAPREKKGPWAKGGWLSGARVSTGAKTIRSRPAATETGASSRGTRASKKHRQGHGRQTRQLRPRNLERTGFDGARPDDDAAGTGR